MKTPEEIAKTARISSIKVSEDDEQRTIMQWARIAKYEGFKIAEVMHHSPNGGKRDAREGAKFKAMGVLAGFPDLFIFVPRNAYAGLFIELKAKKGVISPAQQIMLDRLNGLGYKVAVCFGADHAIRVIKEYLGV